MSKRRRSSQRRHIVSERRDIQREQEILNAPIDAFSQERVVQMFLERLADPTLTDTQAFNIGLALQQFIRGPASMLSNADDPAIAETIAKEREKREKMEEAERRFEQDRAGFIQEVFDKADRIMPVGEKKDKVIAESVNMFKAARDGAIGDRATRHLVLVHQIENGPREDIHCDGVRETRIVQGAFQEVVLPEVIRIMNQRYILKPGMNYGVPKVFADRYREMLRAREENNKREKAMQPNARGFFPDYNEVEINNAKISREYGSHRDPLPIFETGEG